MRAGYSRLRECLNFLQPKEYDDVVDTVSDICTESEQLAFYTGVRLGAVLMMKCIISRFRGLPGFSHAGKMKSFVACISHNVPQVQQEGFAKILVSFLAPSVLQSKQRMTGKAQRGIVETQRLKILPRGLLFFGGEPFRETGHQQQNVRLLDNLVPLLTVKAYTVVARAFIRLEGCNIYTLQ